MVLNISFLHLPWIIPLQIKQSHDYLKMTCLTWILYSAIYEMCLKDSSIPPCLNTEELEKLKLICQILKPFEYATVTLSKDQANSISDALTIILEIEQHINKVENNNLMASKFKKYWSVIEDHILI